MGKICVDGPTSNKKYATLTFKDLMLLGWAQIWSTLLDDNING